MVEYPSVIAEESGALRLFYAGNTYGYTGIGTATSTALRATREKQAAHIVGGGRQWHLLPGEVSWIAQAEAKGRVQDETGAADIPWQGPDANGTVWNERTLSDGFELRVMFEHQADDLLVTMTFMNRADHAFCNIVAPLTVQPLEQKPGERELQFNWSEQLGDIAPGETKKFRAMLSF